MKLHFYKYHGAGNDFILLDNRSGDVILDKAQIEALCNRHTGIGADGLMLLQAATGAAFHMVYYNSDGGESTMCGNGGRCIAAFARQLGMVTGSNARFTAIDGLHEAVWNSDGNIRLQMVNVNGIEHTATHSILNTGSPHYVLWADDVQNEDVSIKGRQIRMLPLFQPKGINVNFVQRLSDDTLWVRTYERGVEDETLSCGTGVTAAAIAATGAATGTFEYTVHTPGGILNVAFQKTAAGKVQQVWLTGPAQFVFEGDISI